MCASVHTCVSEGEYVYIHVPIGGALLIEGVKFQQMSESPRHGNQGGEQEFTERPTMSSLSFSFIKDSPTLFSIKVIFICILSVAIVLVVKDPTER